MSLILVAHGVNLDLLGRREPLLYGHQTLDAINQILAADAPRLAQAFGLPEPQLVFFQTNREDAMFDKIAEPFGGILINPGAWTHTSLALADRLRGIRTPYVEVHLSNLAAREPIRHISHAAPSATGVVYGFGAASYRAGLWGLMLRLHEASSSMP